MYICASFQNMEINQRFSKKNRKICNKKHFHKSFMNLSLKYNKVFLYQKKKKQK